MAEREPTLEPECVREGADIIGAELETPVRRIAASRATVIPQVQVDDLHAIGQPREPRPEVGVVEAARTAVDEDHRRPG